MFGPYGKVKVGDIYKRLKLHLALCSDAIGIALFPVEGQEEEGQIKKRLIESIRETQRSLSAIWKVLTLVS